MRRSESERKTWTYTNGCWVCVSANCDECNTSAIEQRQSSRAHNRFQKLFMQSVFSAVAVNGYREYAQQRHNTEEKNLLLTVCVCVVDIATDDDGSLFSEVFRRNEKHNQSQFWKSVATRPLIDTAGQQPNSGESIGLTVLVKISHRIGFNNSIDEQANIDRLTETVALQVFLCILFFRCFCFCFVPTAGRWPHHNSRLSIRFDRCAISFIAFSKRNEYISQSYWPMRLAEKSTTAEKTIYNNFVSLFRTKQCISCCCCFVFLHSHSD